MRSGRNDEQEFLVPQVRYAPYLLAGGVVDADLGADVALVVVLEHFDAAAGGEQGLHLGAADEALVTERQDEGLVPRQGVEDGGQGGAAAAARVEGRAAGAHVGSLAGQAVDLGRIP